MRDPELIPLAATFAAVVREGSLRGAARALGMSKATVSRQLQMLETALGLRLLERSSRRVRATEEGTAMLAMFESVGAAWDEGLAQLTATRAEATGRLRITASHAMIDGLIGPALRPLLERYPSVDVELVASDYMVDLVAEGIDVAIRTGPLPDSSMQRVHLATTRERLVAAPSLLERLGDPVDPNTAPWLEHSALQRGAAFELFPAQGAAVRVTPDIRARSASSSALMSLLMAGVGVGLVPEAFIRRQLDDGALVGLPWTGREVTIEAVFPAGRLAPPRVRRFLELLAEPDGTPPNQAPG